MQLLLQCVILCSNKPGHTIFTTWSSIWDREAGDRISPGPKTFLMDQYLPVWVQCTQEGCSKWRKLPPSIDLRHVRQDIVKCVDCSVPEDEVRENYWTMGTLSSMCSSVWFVFIKSNVRYVLVHTLLHKFCTTTRMFVKFSLWKCKFTAFF